jgi:hypothetical protein
LEHTAGLERLQLTMNSNVKLLGLPSSFWTLRRSQHRIAVHCSMGFKQYRLRHFRLNIVGLTKHHHLRNPYESKKKEWTFRVGIRNSKKKKSLSLTCRRKGRQRTIPKLTNWSIHAYKYRTSPYVILYYFTGYVW